MMYCCSYYGPFTVDVRLALGLTEEPGKEDREEWDEQTWEEALPRNAVCVAWWGAILFS